MKNLNVPTMVGVNIYDDITAAKLAKHGKIQKHLQRVRIGVLQAYSNYIQSVPNVDTLVPLVVRPLHKKSLLHTYSSSTQPLKTLKDDLEKAPEAARCPFCQISESSTFDHYLPKEIYPEFSVLPQNLIPCCSKCNTHKRALIIDKNTNVRLFLHPYYDIIPNVNFVKVDISFKNKALLLSYSIYHNKKLSKDQFTHLTNHFDKLKLAQRFRKASLIDLSGMYKHFNRLANISPNRLKKELLNEASKYSDWGVNYWRNVLFSELANNNDFINGGYQSIK
ncbi:hypothetical protein RJO59_004696 [Enterobacter hormaechei]|nr:hypothetical protein [Enterobacter hormaechei]ELC7205504.1 hypothetical protein [Enterobacter hormaechei]